MSLLFIIVRKNKIKVHFSIRCAHALSAASFSLVILYMSQNTRATLLTTTGIWQKEKDKEHKQKKKGQI